MTTDDRLLSGATSESSLPPNKSSGDIVERLRDPRFIGQEGLRHESAAEIERLRREVERVQCNHDDVVRKCNLHASYLAHMTRQRVIDDLLGWPRATSAHLRVANHLPA